MSHEYIVRINEEDDAPSMEQLENVLSRIPGYFGQRQYPNNIAFEFRLSNNQDIKNMPDLYVTCRHHEIIIASNNGEVLGDVLAALVIEFVNESKNERIEVLRA